MKRLTAFWLSACFLCTISVQAQSFIPERDSSDISLFEYATKIPKRNNVFNLDLEMHASFNTSSPGTSWMKLLSVSTISRSRRPVK